MKLNRIFTAVLAICISLCTQTTQAQLPALCYPGSDGNGSIGCSLRTVDNWGNVTNALFINTVNNNNQCAPGGCGSSSYNVVLTPTMNASNKTTALFETNSVTYTLQKYDFANASPNTWIDVEVVNNSFPTWTAPLSPPASYTLPAYSKNISDFGQYALVVEIKKAGVVMFSYRYCLGTFVPNSTTTTLNNQTKINGVVTSSTPLKICYTGSGTGITLSVPYLGVAPVCTVQVWKTDNTYSPNTTLISSLSATYSNYGSPGTYNLNPPYAYTDGYYKVIISGTNHCGTSFGPIVAKYEVVSQPTGTLYVGYQGGSGWVSHGATGNAACSPINTCNSNPAVGNGSGTGTVTGINFKLEKLASGTCSSPTWSTIFDGSANAPWNFGNTINSWATLYAPLQQYAISLDPTGYTIFNQYLTQYMMSSGSGLFKLTTYIYNSACTSTPLVKVAYLSRTNATCKTDGEEVATGLENVAESTTDITAYPNPATNSFTIAFNNTKYNGASIKIYDVAGRLIEQRENLQTADNVFNVNAYNNGIFIYHVKLANGDVTSGRFLKE